MSSSIPINPEILRWARNSLNLQLDEVAARMHKEPSDIEAWEHGVASPTYVQLENLAYKIYKRPLALFFFSEVPVEDPIKQSFRTLPESERQNIPPRVLYLRRFAKVLQLNLSELHGGVNPASRNILLDLNFSPSVEVAEMAKEVRTYLGIELAEQQRWDSTDKAFQGWRTALEECGVFVFKNSFRPRGMGESPFSGFCLYDEHFPIIYVNNNNAKSRQVFTLFHELSHLLMRTGGIDTRRDDYIEGLSGNNKRIEVLCNQFASAFLVPDLDFTTRTTDAVINDYAISEWANLYCVSRETILRRLRDQRRVNSQYYQEKVQQWLDDPANAGGNMKGGGNYYSTKGVYLGERYIETVFSHYHQGRISVAQAADYLGEKVNNVSSLEEWLFRQGTTIT